MFYLREKSAGEYAARLSVETPGKGGETMSLYVDMDEAHFFDPATERNIFYGGRQ